MNRRLNLASVVLAITMSLIILAAAFSRESVQTQKIRPASESSNSTAPTSADVNQRDNALVRVIAAISDSPSVDVLNDDRVVFPDLGYKTVTEYRELPDDQFTFRVRTAGQAASKSLAENSEWLSSGGLYTLVVFGEPDGNVELVAFSDNLTPPPSGKAKVRVIHAAPEIGEVDFYAVGRDTLFRGVNSGSESSYSEVDPMEVTLQMRAGGQQNSLLNVNKVRFEAGKVYTIVIVGHAQRPPRLEAIRIEDQFLGTPSTRLQ